ncbi:MULTISPECIES: helix-turn-helix domain-containing protein [unclassified Paenibacillus]|uniref:helix-turn-helix domain-containing protein n=1 Tax=unclassified Paenibacillus TaxID=185978 RepID=UPI0006FD0875|nr:MULTISPECIES: helix-turn-helix transcriptional regulator [unclassified Paenibacillus]KQY85268.1 transcriptional regulator [Paenibacillus sp. Root52]QZN76206.1 helix-turn-helix domain-containing protein [Paenibacillus sp. DR312]
MHDRIKAIREALKMSQREFGERLGVSRDVISNLEYNRVEIKDLMVKHICERYGINENWLTTGEGDMFLNEWQSNKKLDEAIAIFKELQPQFQDFALEQIRKLADLQAKQNTELD